MVHHSQDSADPRLPRRDVLVRLSASIAALPLISLAACASSRRDANLAEVAWPKGPRPTPANHTSTSSTYTPPPAPTPSSSMSVIRRSEWAKGGVIPSRMDPMQPVNKITLHHDGMPSGFTSTDKYAAAAHAERIRQAHLDRGFGDVGYHYMIDPAGRVWQGRELKWQGAHVKDQNPGNLGICFMGNYELQQPNQAQLATAQVFISDAMRYYSVRVTSVRTHREMAPTACPGRYLQPRLDSLRSSGSLA